MPGTGLPAVYCHALFAKAGVVRRRMKAGVKNMLVARVKFARLAVPWQASMDVMIVATSYKRWLTRLA